MERAAAFYVDILGLSRQFDDSRLQAFVVGGHSVPLLFQRGASLETTHLSGGTIQPYDGQGPLHIAFVIGAEHLFVWEACQRRNDIDIEGLADWPHGGQSIYFRDPGSHVLELATPGI